MFAVTSPSDDPLAALALSRRDRAILALARDHANGSHDFVEIVRALRAATEELIPAGRVFLLGDREGSPIVGSLVSGVGIAASARGVEIVRVAGVRTIALGGLFR